MRGFFKVVFVTAYALGICGAWVGGTGRPGVERAIGALTWPGSVAFDLAAAAAIRRSDGPTEPQPSFRQAVCQ